MAVFHTYDNIIVINIVYKQKEVIALFEVPDKTDYSGRNPHLRTEQLRPITERKKEFAECFMQLRAVIGQENFEKYIETVHNLTKNDNTLLITAGNELQRMHIQDLTPELKQAFNVQIVKVIGIMKTMF